jgi:translation initiation factor 1
LQVDFRYLTKKGLKMSRKKNEGRLVWSSDGDISMADKQSAPTTPQGDGVVRVSRQTKGRKGKGVTLVTGVPLAGEELKTLAKKLKQRCGSGGTVKDGVIEIQGDHRDVVVKELSEHSWVVKKAGG